MTVGPGTNVAFRIYREATKETAGSACGADPQRFLGNFRRLRRGYPETDRRCILRRYFLSVRLEFVGRQPKRVVFMAEL